MTRHASRVLAFALVAGWGATAGAQVGYPPTASPFRDLVYKQSLTAEAGLMMPTRDPAGVAPATGPLVGVRYAVQFASPLVLSVRAATGFSERDVIDPSRAPGERVVGTQSSILYTADVNVGVALTGFRSWHNIVPELSLGGGFISDFEEADAGGFKLGAPFALVATGGARWVPGGRWQLRADLTDRLYKISYPQTYYQTTGGEPVLGPRESNSRWTHNPTISIGIGYLFDR